MGKKILRCRTWLLGASPPSTLLRVRPRSLPANLCGLLSNSSYGNSDVSKKAGRAGKYWPRSWRIVDVVESVRRMCKDLGDSGRERKEMTNANDKRWCH